MSKNPKNPILFLPPSGGQGAGVVICSKSSILSLVKKEGVV